MSNICDLKISEGKSGSFFFFTYDNRFIIKTISESEQTTLKKELIRPYYELIMENEQTLLGRIYGLYTLRMGMSKVTIIMMENIAPIDSSLVIRRFDLKGSLLGRETKQLNLSEKTKTLKDKDFLDLQNGDQHFINFDNKSRIIISEIIDFDIELLRNCNIMDYSFFVTVAENKQFELNRSLVNNRQYYSSDSKYIYFIGIIDYLTRFDKMKQIENAFKTFMNQKSKHTISAVNPVYYADRFYSFITKEVLNIKT
jgi:1-phosphatidylinositol-4-phosphate 5-kinase